MFAKTILSLLFIQGAAGQCASSCQNCIAKLGNSQSTTNEQCKPCGANGQVWWPCDNPDLCVCNDDGSGIPKPTGVFPMCEETVAIPGNPHNASDARCSACAMGAQKWWPCNNPALCKCAGGSTDSTTVAPPTDVTTPAPTDITTPAPTDITTPAPQPDDNLLPSEIKAYYQWSWTTSQGALSDANIGVLFSGWGNFDESNPLNEEVFKAKLLNEYNGELNGQFKWFSFGGGNDNGKLTKYSLHKFAELIGTAGIATGYKGVMFDVEEAFDDVESSDFECAFAATKAAGFAVGVTTSHSSPYGIANAAPIVEAWLKSNNVDLISPQLYTSGTEPANDYIALTVSWDDYKNWMRPGMKFAPSICCASMLDDAKTHFANLGITVNGFVQWSNTCARRLETIMV